MCMCCTSFSGLRRTMALLVVNLLCRCMPPSIWGLVQLKRVRKLLLSRRMRWPETLMTICLGPVLLSRVSIWLMTAETSRVLATAMFGEVVL